MLSFTHAGGIVFKYAESELRYLVISASKNSHHWVFPKGHIVPGELPEETAKRELIEEAGIEAKVVKLIGQTEFDTDTEHVRAAFYLMEYVREKGVGEHRQKRWCTYDEAFHLLTFPNLRDLLRTSNMAAEELVRRRKC